MFEQESLFFTPPKKAKVDPKRKRVQGAKSSTGTRTQAPKKHSAPTAVRPLPPEFEAWRAPLFPATAHAKIIGIDTETFDPELLTHGPGWGRGVGNIIGVSLSAEDESWYFPMHHTIDTEHNKDPAAVARFMRNILCDETQTKVGANILYDIGWLHTIGVEVKGPIYDVQYAEALLDDWAPSVSLDDLAKKYLGETKGSDALYKWCAESYGGVADGTQRANLYRTSPRLCAFYAEEDARLPAAILEKQWPLLEQQGLLDLFKMECALIPMLHAIRVKGVRVHIEAAEKAREALIEREAQLQAALNRSAGTEINVDSAYDIETVFQAKGLPYNTTKKGNPSFDATFLKACTDPVADMILGVRQLAKARSTFIENYILESNVNGRIYGQFHPLKSDDGGTVSGRFSSSNPNLQNLPSRDPELGPLIRGFFLPEEGEEWNKLDYSQIEYRFLAHFAIGPGADIVREAYAADPNTDFHAMAGELIQAKTGKALSRYHTKTINFGLCYGMGPPKLMRTLELSKAEGAELFAAYHQGAPFVKKTFRHATNKANGQGYIQTIMGRRSRFEMWEKKGRFSGKVLPRIDAVKKYGLLNVQRAGTHKALNRLLQGSAADMLKAAMVEIWKSGTLDILGAPMLTVHDELDFSNPRTTESEEALREVVHLMENALKLNVPVIVDVERGSNWGNVK